MGTLRLGEDSPSLARTALLHPDGNLQPGAAALGLHLLLAQGWPNAFSEKQLQAPAKTKQGD